MNEINFLTEKINNSPEMQKWINTGISLLSLPPQNSQQPEVNVSQPAGNNVPIPEVQPPPQYPKTQNPTEYEQNAGYFSNITPAFLAGVNETSSPSRTAILDARNIWLAKKSYEDADRADKALNEMLQNENLTADQKNLINSKLIDVQNVKKNSSDYANMLRNGGFNLYGFGAENTVGESAQALHNYQQRGMENLLNLPSYQERAFDKEMELAQSGMKPRDINFALEKYELPKIRREMTNEYRDGVALYGTNPDGSLNEFGAEILSRMADVNPISANAYSSLFANPKDTFAADQNMWQNIYNQDNENYRTGMKIGANIWGKQYDATNDLQKFLIALGVDWKKFQENMGLNREQLKLTNEHKDRQLQIEEFKARISEFKAQNEAYRNSPQGQFDSWLIVAPYATGSDDPEVNRQWATNQVAKGNNINHGDVKVQEAVNVFEKEAFNIKNELANGNYDKAKELINSTRIRINSSENKYAGVTTLDHQKSWLDLLTQFEKVANKEITYADMMKNYYESIGKIYLGNGDQYMAYLMNHPNELNEMIKAAPRKSPEEESALKKAVEASGGSNHYGRRQ